MPEVPNNLNNCQNIFYKRNFTQSNMNALLHRHCAKYIYVLPDGLRELMSDISREVLRNHPEQTYTFIADYLDALMITRENARVAARLVDCITEIGVTIVELLTRTGITREDANKAAAIIQVAFRRHLEHKKEFQLKLLNLTKEEEETYFINQIIQQCGISYEKIEEATRIIQEAYRRFRQHEKVEHDLLLGMIDWRVAAKSAIYLYRKTGVSIYEANRAATLIKAAYKGYYTRQVMRRLVEEGHQSFDLPLTDVVGGSILDGIPPSKTLTDDYSTATTSDFNIAGGVMDVLLRAVVRDDDSMVGGDDESSQELMAAEDVEEGVTPEEQENAVDLQEEPLEVTDVQDEDQTEDTKGVYNAAGGTDTDLGFTETTEEEGPTTEEIE